MCLFDKLTWFFQLNFLKRAHFSSIKENKSWPLGMRKISSKNWLGGLMTMGRAATKWSRITHSAAFWVIHKLHRHNFCPVHLPGQNIFCPDKKIFLCYKSTYLLVKWTENDFLAMDKIFSWLKSHFPSILQANIYSAGQKKRYKHCFMKQKCQL